VPIPISSSPADVSLIQRLPTDASRRPSEPHLFQLMVERFRTMPKATIAMIRHRAAAAASSCCRATCAARSGVRSWRSRKSRSASSGRQRHAAAAASGGPRPGAEIVLGCDDIPADVAERWG
jgi:hypothetical protein